MCRARSSSLIRRYRAPHGWRRRLPGPPGCSAVQACNNPHFRLVYCRVRRDGGCTMSTNASELLERVRRLEDEKKRLIEALRRTEEELRQARKTEVLGRLTGAIAHDFNNLLTAVCGFGGILVRRMRSDDPLLEDA